jgi:hypothetical protein
MRCRPASRAEKPCKCGCSEAFVAGRRGARLGLSRRRSRVRVPSLPSSKVPANRHLLLSARTAAPSPTTRLLHRHPGYSQWQPAAAGRDRSWPAVDGRSGRRATDNGAAVTTPAALAGPPRTDCGPQPSVLARVVDVATGHRDAERTECVLQADRLAVAASTSERRLYTSGASSAPPPMRTMTCSRTWAWTAGQSKTRPGSAAPRRLRVAGGALRRLRAAHHATGVRGTHPRAPSRPPPRRRARYQRRTAPAASPLVLERPLVEALALCERQEARGGLVAKPHQPKPSRPGSGWHRSPVGTAPKRRNHAKPLPWVATGCRSERMVRRRSAVRVRQRAPKTCQYAFSARTTG